MLYGYAQRMLSGYRVEITEGENEPLEAGWMRRSIAVSAKEIPLHTFSRFWEQAEARLPPWRVKSTAYGHRAPRRGTDKWESCWKRWSRYVILMCNQSNMNTSNGGPPPVPA